MAATVVGSGQIAGTLTSKRINPRVQSVSSASTITPNADTDDIVDITALAIAPTIANPTGTPVNGQILRIRVKDNGTPRAFTWGSAYVEGTGTALFATTVTSKISNITFQYNTANALNKWQQIAVVTESASAAGGLTNFTETAGTYSSTPWAKLVPSAADTNVGLVLAPKGAGYISAQTPNGSTSGGNQRGTYSVDFQTTRAAASRVASGSHSFLGPSDNSTASGPSSFVLTGSFCTATSYYAGVLSGYQANATQAYSLANGYFVTASSYYGMAFGCCSTTRNWNGAMVLSSGPFGSSGTTPQSQGIFLPLHRQTTNSTSAKAVTDLSEAGGGANNQFVLPNNSAYTFFALVVAHRSDSRSGASTRSYWTVAGGIARDANAASTVLSGGSPTVISNTPGYTLSVTADTTYGALAFNVTGATGQTVNFSVFLFAAEACI